MTRHDNDSDYEDDDMNNSDDQTSSNMEGQQQSSESISIHHSINAINDANSIIDTALASLKPHACSEPGCFKRYAKIGKLNRHLLSHQSVRSHHCSFIGCHRAFARSDHLHRHEKTHSTIIDKKYKCQFGDGECQASYVTSTHLKRHMASHGVAVYQCKISNCNEAFVKSHQLRSHIANKHNSSNSQQSQSLASLSLTSQDSQQRPSQQPPLSSESLTAFPRVESPIVTASPPQAFLCSFSPCSESFSSRSLLTKHVNLHHTPRRFVCSECDAEFSRFLLWKRHFHQHKQEKKTITEIPHQCDHDGCHKTFSSHSNLRVHIRAVHEKSRPHVCSECQRQFSYKHAWQKHIRTKHSQPNVIDNGENVGARLSVKEKAFGRTKRRRSLSDDSVADDSANAKNSNDVIAESSALFTDSAINISTNMISV